MFNFITTKKKKIKSVNFYNISIIRQAIYENSLIIFSDFKNIRNHFFTGNVETRDNS